MDRVRWLFFDVGSTLMDETAAYERRFREMADAAGIPWERVREMARTLYRQGWKGDYEAARALGVALPPWHSECEIPYPDAIYCLRVLRDRVHVGVIANQPPGTKDRLWARGFKGLTELIVASAEAGAAKPDPRIFEIALERAGCEPWEAMMVGDRIDNDILPAKRLGMRTAWIQQGWGRYRPPRGPSEQPDFAVRSLTELASLLLENEICENLPRSGL